MTGTPILLSQFPSQNLVLVVELAFGVAPGTDGPWTDVTADLRAGGVSMTVGRGDEASKTQPATCTFVLDNRSGKYSKGPQSGNPGLRRNIPARVRILLNGTSDLEFQGEAVGFTPGWEDAGKLAPIAIASVVVNGTLHRIEAGDQPLDSAMHHYVMSQPGLVAYWPMEEGSTATSFASAISGGPAMTSSTGLPKPGSYSGFVASAGAPTLGAEMYTASCAGTGSVSGGAQIWFLVNIPPSTLTDQTRIVSINVESTGLTRIDLVYGTAFSGSFGLNAYNGTTLVTNTVGSVNGGANGQDVLVGFNWVSGSGSITLNLKLAGLEMTGATSSTDDLIFSAPITTVDSILIAPDSNCSGVSIGHLFMTNTTVGIGFTVPSAAIAFLGETPTARITRLCSEQGVAVTVTGTSVQTMGVQTVKTFPELLRECETVDLGVLYDGFGQGLSYIARDSRENQQPTLVLNAAAGDIVACDPIDDDLGIVNRFVASRTGGSSATFTDATSTLAAVNIGDKPGSETLNCQTDDYLANYAAFRVNLGEIDDYRYPSLLLAIHSAPRILSGWLATAVSSRIDVKNLDDVRISQDPKDLSFMVEGWNQTITRETWTIAVNCTSYDPWRIAVWANTTGDTGEFIARGDPDGSTVSAPGGLAAGATSLTIATPSGPLWTTASDDFPLYLDVNGQQVTCSAISGASSPQTFTVAATSLRIPDQAAVTVWRNPRLGL